MAYTINLTNGQILTTIADGTINQSSTSLTLIGKNYSNYGTFLNDNFVHLLENGSNSTPPTTPLTGQLWWDTAGNLNVYNGSKFTNLAAITSSTTAPSGPVTGNQWWDTANQQFNVYNGSGWTLIGPAFTSNTGTSGTVVGQILDNEVSPQTHVAVNVYVSNTLVGIISKDSTYTPATSITGFSTIKPGFNLASTSAIAGIAFWGTASDASGLGNVAAANYARTDVAETFDNTVTINNNSGLTIGTSNNFTTGVSGSIVQLTNNVNNADMAIRANIGGTLANVISVTGGTGAITIPNLIAVSGNVSAAGYVLATQGENATSSTTGAVRVTGGMGLTGGIHAAGNIQGANIIATGSFSTPSGNITSANLVATNQTVTTALTVSGAATVGTTLGVTGATTLSTVSTSGNVTVGGSANIVGTLTVSSISASGGVTISGALGATGNLTASALTINNSATIGTTLGVTGATVLGSSLAVTGATTLSSNVATANLAVTGQITATNNITAYYSDERLKTKLGDIENALDKIDQIATFYYEANEIAQSLGYAPVREVGVGAQTVKLVLPEATAPAPIDPQYLTVQYERLIPLLIEGIKELRREIKDIKDSK